MEPPEREATATCVEENIANISKLQPRYRQILIELPERPTASPLFSVWISPYATGAGLRSDSAWTKVGLVLLAIPFMATIRVLFSDGMGSSSMNAAASLSFSLASGVGLFMLQLVLIGGISLVVWFLQRGMLGNAHFSQVLGALTLGLLPLVLAGALITLVSFGASGFGPAAGFSTASGGLPMILMPGMSSLLVTPLILPAGLWSLVLCSNLLGGVCQLTPWHGFGLMTAAFFVARFVLPFLLPVLFLGGMFSAFSFLPFL
ncbi:MAG: hypothetical protein RLZZ303_2874 [Candidatus Hydrogenedentota bacterium]